MIIRVLITYLVLSPFLVWLVNGNLVLRYLRRPGSVLIPDVNTGFWLRRRHADRAATANMTAAVAYGFMRSVLECDLIAAAQVSLDILQHAQVIALESSSHRLFAVLDDLMPVVPLVAMVLISVLNWWLIYWLIAKMTGIQRESWRASAISAGCSCPFFCIPIWWLVSTRSG